MEITPFLFQVSSFYTNINNPLGKFDNNFTASSILGNDHNGSFDLTRVFTNGSFLLTQAVLGPKTVGRTDHENKSA